MNTTPYLACEWHENVTNEQVLTEYKIEYSSTLAGTFHALMFGSVTMPAASDMKHDDTL